MEKFILKVNGLSKKKKKNLSIHDIGMQCYISHDFTS